MVKIINAKHAAKVINEVLSSDSGIVADEAQLIAAIDADAEKRGRLPSEGEIAELVMGDSDGDVDDISTMWPKTSAVLASLF